MTLFPGWSPLREGYPFIKDWNELAGAIARARGVNGINLSIQAGALVVSGNAVATGHAFKMYAANSAQDNQAVLQIGVRPGIITTGLWVDSSQEIQKGSHVPTILVGGDDIPLDRPGNPPFLSGLTEMFTIWVHVFSGDHDDWIHTRIVSTDSAGDDPENDEYNGYLMVGKGRVLNDGGSYSIEILNQYLLTSKNHDKASEIHFWWD